MSIKAAIQHKTTLLLYPTLCLSFLYAAKRLAAAVTRSLPLRKSQAGVLWGAVVKQRLNSMSPCPKAALRQPVGAWRRLL